MPGDVAGSQGNTLQPYDLSLYFCNFPNLRRISGLRGPLRFGASDCAQTIRHQALQVTEPQRRLVPCALCAITRG